MNFLKSELRQEMLKRRAAFSEEEVKKGSESVADRLTSLIPLHIPRVIMAYDPLGQEVDLRFWLQTYQNAGHTILLPRVTGKNLQAIPFTGAEKLEKSKFGVREPVGMPYPPGNIELVLVPGLAFDYAGYRLGFGQGYYDRFLPGLQPSTMVWGVAYHFQMVETVGRAAHDWPMQKIITDQKILSLA